jgi:hypothetical protein
VPVCAGSQHGKGRRYVERATGNGRRATGDGRRATGDGQEGSRTPERFPHFHPFTAHFQCVFPEHLAARLCFRGMMLSDHAGLPKARCLSKRCTATMPLEECYRLPAPMRAAAIWITNSTARSIRQKDSG